MCQASDGMWIGNRQGRPLVMKLNEVSQVLRAERKIIGLDWMGEKRRGEEMLYDGELKA